MDSGADRTFCFDYVYSASVSQEEVYETSVLPLLTTLLDGYNVTGTVIHIGSGAVLRSRSLFCRLQLKKSIISTFLTTPQPSSLKNAFIFKDLFF